MAWIEELEAELVRRGLPPVPATGWALDMGRFDEADSRRDLDQFLGGQQSACGYTVLQLLPIAGEHRLLLAVIADQVAEYSHHVYAVVAIGLRGEPGNGLHWRQLAPLLRHRGAPLPPRHIVRPDVDPASEGQRLAALLTGYDLPLDEQRRWRM